MSEQNSPPLVTLADLATLIARCAANDVHGRPPNITIKREKGTWRCTLHMPPRPHDGFVNRTQRSGATLSEALQNVFAELEGLYAPHEGG